MKNAMKTFMLAGVALTMAACASCPQSADYHKVPYVDRTAGTGVAVYGGDCSPRPVAVAPESAPVRSAEPVFQAKQRK